MTRWPPRPALSGSFYKGHGLGNDYLVFEEGVGWAASPGNVRRVCDRHRGVGSDGIVVLLGGEPGDEAPRLRMFNPDGGEFERSGNGLRVFASYLARRDSSIGRIEVEVGGARVPMAVHGRAGSLYDVSVDMGRAATGPDRIAMAREALDTRGRLPGPGGAPMAVVPVWVGNPHVVVRCEDESELTDERLSEVGPFVAAHPSIAHGTNVQLVVVDGERRCRALVWERGVGPTTASGTSACAVAVAAVTSGEVEPGEVFVRMPGGELTVRVSEELEVELRGPVEEILEGTLSPRLLATFEPAP